MSDSETWQRQMRQQWTCQCGNPERPGVGHRYPWEGDCRVEKPANFRAEPEMGYRCKFHRPRFYRYKVARVDRNGPLRWFRGPLWNAYRSPYGTARIGVGVVLGRWAYCVKWARSVPFEAVEGGA